MNLQVAELGPESSEFNGGGVSVPGIGLSSLLYMVNFTP